MQKDETLLTAEEVVIVQKLKNEMFNALTLEHMKFYKQEIDKIYAQAVRREEFMETMKTRKKGKLMRQSFI
ncbi:hypothetical protein [Metabacillus sp. RGM 3146]|uniref:hypothetical protein n=1 Tax=Metabacillus sp. RGM 3146 TaxID=3401092 RepID=UPI003B9D3475